MMQPLLRLPGAVQPECLSVRHAKREFQDALKLASAAEILPAMPEPGVLRYVLSNSRLNLYTWLDRLLQLAAAPADVWFTSWNMNQVAASAVLDAMQAGRIATAAAVLGKYFAIREKSVYHAFAPEFQRLGGRFGLTDMHAKVVLFHAGDSYVVITSIANLTTNPRQEQFTIDNDRGAFEFFANWIRGMLHE